MVTYAHREGYAFHQEDTERKVEEKFKNGFRKSILKGIQALSVAGPEVLGSLIRVRVRVERIRYLHVNPDLNPKLVS